MNEQLVYRALNILLKSHYVQLTFAAKLNQKNIPVTIKIRDAMKQTEALGQEVEKLITPEVINKE